MWAWYVKIQVTLYFSNSRLFFIVYEKPHKMRGPGLCWVQRMPVSHSVIGTRIWHLLKRGSRWLEEHMGRVIGWAMSYRDDVVGFSCSSRKREVIADTALSNPSYIFRTRRKPKTGMVGAPCAWDMTGCTSCASEGLAGTLRVLRARSKGRTWSIDSLFVSQKVLLPRPLEAEEPKDAKDRQSLF